MEGAARSVEAASAAGSADSAAVWAADSAEVVPAEAGNGVSHPGDDASGYGSRHVGLLRRRPTLSLRASRSRGLRPDEYNAVQN